MTTQEPPKTPGTAAPVRLWVQLWHDLERAQRRRLAAALAAMLLGSLLTALLPLFIALLVDRVIRQDQVASLSHALGPLALPIAALALISTAQVVQHQQVHTVTTAFTADMRQRVYAALLRWDLARYVEDAEGAIYGRANRSVEGAERLSRRRHLPDRRGRIPMVPREHS